MKIRITSPTTFVTEAAAGAVSASSGATVNAGLEPTVKLLVPGSAPVATMPVFARTAATPTSRRANANAAQASGVPAGPPAPPKADCEPIPNHDNTPATTLVGGRTAGTDGAAATGSDVTEKLDTDGADDTVSADPPDVTAGADRRSGAGSDVELNDGRPLLLPRRLLLLSGLAAPDEATPALEIAGRCRLPDGPVTDFGREPSGDEPPAAPDTDVFAPPEADALDDGDLPDADVRLDGADVPDPAEVPGDPVVGAEPPDVDVEVDPPL